MFSLEYAVRRKRECWRLKRLFLLAFLSREEEEEERDERPSDRSEGVS